MTRKQYYQIGEVCKIAELPQSTIRFWEKSFASLRPSRSSGGRRYYNNDQIELLTTLKRLLHEEGYTLEGAKKRILSEKKSAKNDSEPSLEVAEEVSLPTRSDSDIMKRMKDELKEILNLLSRK